MCSYTTFDHNLQVDYACGDGGVGCVWVSFWHPTQTSVCSHCTVWQVILVLSSEWGKGTTVCTQCGTGSVLGKLSGVSSFLLSDGSRDWSCLISRFAPKLHVYRITLAM